VKRRELNGALVAAIVYALWERRALAAAVDEDWVAAIAEHAQALRTGAIDAGEWAEAMRSLAATIDIDDVLRRADFERVAAQLKLPESGAGAQRVRLPGVDGLKLFGMRRGCAIVPHGHDGSASMHLVVHGRLRGRQWDRIADESGALLVRPTSDRTHARGDASTATQDQDNVHWFEAESSLAFVFAATVSALDPTRESRRVYLDPDRATVESGDLVRMPVIGQVAALRRYGRRRR
jgi:hypothetical protein